MRIYEKYINKEDIADIEGVSEIGGQTLRAYSTCCKDEKKSYKQVSGNAFFASYMYGRTTGNCRKAQRFYQETFLQR